METVTAQKVLAKRLGHSTLSVRKAQHGYSGEVFRCEVDGKEIYARVSTKDIRYLEEVYCLVAEKNIPTSAYFDSWYDDEHKCFVLMRYKIEGIPLKAVSSHAERSKLLHNYGQILQNIHTIRLSGFGDLSYADRLIGQQQTWLEYLRVRQKPWDELVSEKLITADQVKYIESIYSGLEKLTFDTPSLLHNDFHGNNLLVFHHGPAGVIDFSNSISGDIHWDLAESFYFFSEDDRKTFLDGYGGSLDLPRIQQYEILIALDKVIWSHNEGLDIFPQRYQRLLSYLKAQESKD